MDSFVDWENIVLYSLERLGTLPEIVNRLLGNTRLSMEIAYVGQEETLRNHTWINRAKANTG